MSSGTVYFLVPILLFSFFVCVLRICFRAIFKTAEGDEGQTYFILDTRRSPDGSMRTLDFGPEGIVLHRMPTQQSRYPKTRQDFPHLHSLPPTYDEATSGRDRSVKVEEYVGSVSVAEPEGELGDTARSDDLPPSARRNDEAFSGLLPERPPPPYSAPPLHQTDIHEEEEEEGVSDNQPLLPA